MTALGSLIVQTIQAPRTAATQLFSLGLSPEVVWTGFALTQVLNAFAWQLTSLIPGMDDEATGYAAIIAYLLLISAAQVLIAVALTVVGRLMSGGGTFLQMLTMVSWISFVETVLIAPLFLIITLLAPSLTVIALVLVFVGVLYVIAQFVDTAHQFGSAWRAFGVVVISILSMTMVFRLFLTLF